MHGYELPMLSNRKKKSEKFTALFSIIESGTVDE